MACQEQRSCFQMQKSDSSSSFSVDSASHHDVENHLQSMGFIVDNGRPTFKLDDSTTMHSNVLLPGFSMVDADDPASFVVLGKDSMDSIQASSLATFVDIQQKSMAVDYDSMITSWNSTDASQKVSDLLQENGKLKETLKQNNIAMKQQFNSLTTWQGEILKIQQNHKEKFVEMRELINYLKKENAELKLKLSSKCTDNTETGCTIIDSIDMKDEATDIKFMSIPNLQEKVSSLMNELSSSRLESAELSSNFENLLSMRNLMSSQLEEATSTIQEQREIIKQLKLTSQQKHSESSYTKYPKSAESTLCENCITKDLKIVDLKESIALLEGELRYAASPIFLIDDVKSLKHEDCTSSDTTLQEKVDVVDNQINNDEELRKSLEVQETSKDWSLLEKEKQELIREKAALEEEKKLIASQKNSLETEYKNINDAKELLQQERISLQEEKASLDQQSQLYEDYKTSLQVEKKQLDAKYDHLVTEISTLHESIQRKELHIQQLNIESERHLEDATLLQTQVQFYAEDFAEEKKVREKLFDENNKLNVDLQKQIELNQFLHMEIRRLNGGQTEESQSEEAFGTQREMHVIAPITSTFVCPKCNCYFRRFQSLERHVQVENTNLLRIQLKIYKEDFTREKTIKEVLLAEKNKAEADLKKQIEMNKTLEQEIERLKDDVNYTLYKACFWIVILWYLSSYIF